MPSRLHRCISTFGSTSFLFHAQRLWYYVWGFVFFHLNVSEVRVCASKLETPSPQILVLFPAARDRSLLYWCRVAHDLRERVRVGAGIFFPTCKQFSSKFFVGDGIHRCLLEL